MSLKVRKLAIQVADITDFGVASGVSMVAAGTGISVSPGSGLGAITVTNAGVTQILAGTNVSLSPASGIGAVTVSVPVVGIIDTITPKAVNVAGQTAGVNTKSSASDHAHQLASPLAGSVKVVGPTSGIALTAQQDTSGVQNTVFLVQDVSALTLLSVNFASPILLVGSAGGTPNMAPTVDPLVFGDSLNTGQLQVQNASPQVTVFNNMTVNGALTVLGAFSPTLPVTGTATVPTTGFQDGGTQTQTANSQSAFMFNAVAAVKGAAGLSGLQVRALSFTSGIQSNAATSLGSMRGVEITPNYSAAGGGTTFPEITDAHLASILNGFNPPTVTTWRHLWINPAAAPPGTTTTHVGLDITTIAGATTNIAIRQSGTTESNRYSAKSRFGDQTLPVANVDATGTAGTTMKALGKNVTVVENLDETQASATVPGVDTALKSYALPANNYSHVIVEGEGYVLSSLGATRQAVNIKVRAAGVQVGNTIVYEPTSIVVNTQAPFSIKASFVQAGAATLDISIGASVADPNTAVFLNSLRVYGEV